MARFHTTSGGNVPFTAEEEAAQDAIDAAHDSAVAAEITEAGGAANVGTLRLRKAAKKWLDGLTAEQRAFVAGFDAARKGDNVLRKWLMDFKAAVAVAGTLAQLKTAVAALDNLPALNKADVANIILGLIDTPSA